MTIVLCPQIGGMKGTIPAKNLKQSSLKIDEEALVHVPEVEFLFYLGFEVCQFSLLLTFKC